MSSYEVAVITRPRRRTHLAEPATTGRANTWCGINIPTHDAIGELVPLVGAGVRVKNDLVRLLGNNTCARCTLIATGMLVLYAARDAGRAW